MRRSSTKNKRNTSKNKIIRLRLIKIYGKICFLGEPLTKKNYITLHHILKKQFNGATTIDNGALLSRLMHEDLHFIEHWYYGEYEYVNEYLKYYKETQDQIEKQRMNKYVKKLTKEKRV